MEIGLCACHGGKIKRLVWFGLFLLVFPKALPAGEALLTPLEESGYQALPDSKQITAFLERLAAFSQKVEVVYYGRSAGGRPLAALLISNDPKFLQTGQPVPGKLTVMLVGGQHGTEPSGTEALQSLARDVVVGPLQPLLEHLDLILVPNSNPDGRDLHRRVNANGVNLSTDYVLLSQPETRGLVKLLLRFQPHALLDVHESAVLKKKSLGAQGYLTDFEAQFEYANHPNVDPGLRYFSNHVFLPELLEAVNSRGLSARHYIGEITSIDQAITHGGISLRNLRNYAGMRGIFALLVENRLDPPGDWPTPRNIAMRVAKQRLCLKAFLEKVAEFEESILSRLRPVRGKGPLLVALRAQYAPSSQSKIALSLRRLDGEQVTKEFAYHGQIVAKDWVFLPKTYAVTAHQAEFAALLDRHGIGYRRLARAQRTRCLCQKIVQIKVRRWQQGIISRREVQVQLKEEIRQIRLKPGDLVLDLRQEGGALAFLLLDPRSFTNVFQDPIYTALLAEGKEFFGMALIE
ncbi:MAG: M14 family metallopeptidase [Methylohalobius sp.]